MVVPVGPILLTLLLPWDSMLDIDLLDPDPRNLYGDLLSPYLSPAWLALTALSYTAYGLCVYFSYRDYRQLESFGVTKPFHWGWAFLSPVYQIGRSVVVMRRSGHGSAPLWVTVAVLLISMIVSVVIMVAILSSMGDMMLELRSRLTPR